MGKIYGGGGEGGTINQLTCLPTFISKIILRSKRPKKELQQTQVPKGGLSPSRIYTTLNQMTSVTKRKMTSHKTEEDKKWRQPKRRWQKIKTTNNHIYEKGPGRCNKTSIIRLVKYYIFLLYWYIICMNKSE